MKYGFAKLKSTSRHITTVGLWKSDFPTLQSCIPQTEQDIKEI